MEEIAKEINRLINTLNAPALAFNEIATENGFPLIPVIENLNPLKLERIEDSEDDITLPRLYMLLMSAANIASLYQQALSKVPRDRALVDETKLNYEQARDNLVAEFEKANQIN